MNTMIIFFVLSCSNENSASCTNHDDQGYHSEIITSINLSFYFKR